MKSKPAKRFSLLAQAALASTLFCVALPTHAALTPLDDAADNQNSGTAPYNTPGNGYDYQNIINDVSFTINNGDNIGKFGTISVDKTTGTQGAELKFAGTSSVVGTIGPSNPIDRIQLEGGIADIVLFQDDIILNEAINFITDTTAKLDNNVDVTGDVDNLTGSAGKGTLYFLGNGSVSGKLGDTDTLKDVFINGAASTVVLNGDINVANGVNFNVVSATTKLNIGDTVTVNNNIDNKTGVTTGTLQFVGDATVNGTVGQTQSLSNVNFLGAGKTVQITGDVTSTNLNFLGTTTADINGNINANVNFSANGTLEVAPGKNISLAGNIDNTLVGSFGTVVFEGDSTVSGTVGATNPIFEIDINGAAGTTVNLTQNVAAQTVVFNNTGTADFDGNLTGNILYKADALSLFAPGKIITGNVDSNAAGLGTLEFQGASSVSGTIGATNAIKEIKMDGNATTVSLNGNVATANGINFDGVAGPTSVLTLGDGITVTGNIGTNVAVNTGTVQFAGDATVTGSIGVTTFPVATTTAISHLNFMGAGKTINIAGDVNTVDINFFNTTTASIGGNIVGDVNFNADGTLIVAPNKTLTAFGKVDNKSGTPGVGTLEFLGSSTVSGAVGITDSIKEIQLLGGVGTTVTLSQDTAADNIIINKGTLDANGKITGNIIFNDDGTAIIANNKSIIGGVDAITPNIGTLQLEGAGVITGNIGQTEAIKLLNLNTLSAVANSDITLNGAVVNAQDIFVDDDGASSTTLILDNSNMVLTTTNGIKVSTTNLDILDILNAKTLDTNIGNGGVFKLVKVGANGDTTINGDIFATTVQFQGNNTLTLSNGSDVNGNITTLTNNTGKLTLDGNNTITGSIGSGALQLNTITLNNGSYSFGNNVFSQNFNINGPTVIANFNNNVTTNVNYLQDGVVNLADGKTLTGNVNNLSGNPNIGTFNFVGGGSVTGTMGATNALKLIQVNSAGVGAKTVTLTGSTIKAQTIDVNDDGALASTLVLDNTAMTLTGNITANTDSLDILNILNATSLTGNIGTVTESFNLIKVAQNVDTTITGNIFATLTEIEGTKTLSLGNNSTVTGDIDSAAANTGNLKFLGNGTVTGTIGATNVLNKIDLTGTGTTVNFQDDVKVATGNINFAPGASQSSTLTLSDGVDITGNINNTTGFDGRGTLTFLGDGSVSGKIGNVTGPNQALFAVNFLGFGKTITLNEVHALSINIINPNTINLNNSIATNINISKDPTTINLADNQTLTGNVDNVSGGPNVGTFNFVGSGTVTGNIGNSNPLLLVQANTGFGANETIVLNGAVVKAQTVKINDDGATPTTLVLDNPVMNFAANITTKTANLDILDVKNAVSLTGNISNLALMKVGQNVNTAVNGDITASVVQFQGNKALTLSDGSDINGSVATLVNNTGTLNLQGGHTITGTVGAPLLSLNAVNLNGTGKTVNIQNDIFSTAINFNKAVTGNFSGNINSDILFFEDGQVFIAAGKNINGKVDNLGGFELGTLNFAGSSTVTGTVGQTNPIKDINVNGAFPSVVNFLQDVAVSGNTVFINSTGTTNFSGNVTGDIVYNADGKVTLADGKTIDGNVDANSPNIGTLTLNGAGEVTGTIGETNALKLLQLNQQNLGPNKVITLDGTIVNAQEIQVFDDGATPTTLILNNDDMVFTTQNGLNVQNTDDLNILNISRAKTINSDIGQLGLTFHKVLVGANGNTTVDGDIYASIVEFNGNNTLTLTNNSDIFGNVTTLTNDTGKLTLDGTHNVTGTIGAPLLALNTITITGNGIVDFGNKIYTTNLDIDGLPTVNINDDVTTNIHFFQDGTLFLADGKTVTGIVDNVSGIPNTGSFNFKGGGSVTGSMGASSPLKLIQVNSLGAGAKTVTLTGDVIEAQTIKINDDGIVGSTLVLDNAAMTLEGDITAKTNNLDVLDIKNATSLTGNIGTIAQSLNLIKVAQNVDTTISGNIFATLTQFQGNNTLFLDADTTVTGDIDSTVSDQGILEFLGDATVTGKVGNVNKLNTINSTGDGTTVNFQNDVKVGSNNLNFAPGSSAGSTILLNDGVDITGNIDNTSGTNKVGTLSFLGDGSVSGKIGNVTGPNQALFAVNLFGGAGKTVTLNEVNADSINILDTGTLNLNDSSTANVNFSKDGVVNLADGETLFGNVNNISGVPNIGTFNFVGGGAVTGDMGFSQPLKLITVNTSAAAGRVVTLEGTTVRANTIHINDGGSKTVLVLDNPNMKLTANITAQNNNIDELNILNATSLSGNIGSLGQSLNLIRVGQNDDTTITGDIFSFLTQFQGDNTLFLGEGSDVFGKIDTTAANTGTLTFLGNGSVSDVIGGINPIFALNIKGGNGKVVNLKNDVFVGSGDVNFAAGAKANTLLLLEDGVTINANIDNTTGFDNIGTVQFKGDGAVTGTIGDTNSLFAINLTGGAGKVVTLQGNVNVGIGDINFAPGATSTTKLELADGILVNASVDNTTGVDGIGIIEFLGDGEITGQIGPSNKLNLVNLTGGPGKTVNFVNTVNANKINFTNDGQATFSNGFNLTTPITTTANNQGTATFLGNTFIGAQIGAAGKSLKAVNFNGVGDTVVELDNDIFAINTNLNNGRLISDGNQTITGNLNINNGTTLRLNLDNSPLNVVGTFNLNNNSTLDINLNSQLAKTGFVKANVANIDPNAHLNLTNTPQVIQDGVYKFLIVDGGPGSSLNVLPVIGDSLLLDFKTVIDAANFDLLLEINSLPVANFANQSNTIGIANALDNLSPEPTSGSLFDIVNALSEFQDAASLNRDLAALAPIVDGAVFYEPINTQIMAYDTYKQRLRHVRNVKEQLNNPALSGFASGGSYNGCSETWGKFFGRTSDQANRHAVAGYQNHMLGFALGSDVLLNPYNLLGMAVSYAHLDIDHAVSDSQTGVDSYQIGIYGQHEFAGWCWPVFINWEASLGYNDYETQRDFTFASLHFAPSADYHGWMFGADAEVGYDYLFSCWHIMPIANLFYSHLGIGSFTESGMDNANQHVDSTDFDLLRGGIGLRAMFDIPYIKNYTTVVLEPEMHAFAFYDFVTSRMDVTSQFVGAGPSFATLGFEPSRGTYNLGASLTTYGKRSPLTFTLSYDYEKKTGYTAHNGFLRVGYLW